MIVGWSERNYASPHHITLHITQAVDSSRFILLLRYL